MNTQTYYKNQYKQHYERFAKLEDLLEKIDYAALGEDSEMRSEYQRLRAKVVEEMHQESSKMDEILQRALQFV